MPVRRGDRLQGRFAVVTGAGSGFGHATAMAFAREGAASVALIERDAGRLAMAHADVERLGCRAVSVTADLGSADRTRIAFGQAMDQLGRIDILVSWMTE